MRCNYSTYRKCARIRRFGRVSLPRAFPVERLIALGSLLGYFHPFPLFLPPPSFFSPFPLAFLSIRTGSVTENGRALGISFVTVAAEGEINLSRAILLLNSLVHNKVSRAHCRIKLIGKGIVSANNEKCKFHCKFNRAWHI